MELKKVKAEETKVFLEGVEVCRQYFKTDKITFGSSYLLPGQTGATDHGHKDSHEVFFVSQGHVIMETNPGEFVEMVEGDAVLIPPGVPHTLTNIGEGPALVTWSLAPSEV